MADILIIDDDEELFSLLEEYLEDEGFSCVCCAKPEDGLQKIASYNFDILILNVMLPGINGFEVLRRIRADKNKADLPVLMLMARGEEIDRVVGLEMGADDYLAKPFSPRELVARLRAILRRAARPKAEVQAAAARQIENLLINPASLYVMAQGVKKDLSVSELRLLTHLVQNAGQVVSRDFLYTYIFGHPAYPMDRSLDMLVSRLRRKLGARPDGGERIKAARGEGYMYLLAGEI